MNCTNGQGDDDDDFCVNCAQPVSHLDYGETGKFQMDNITTRINSNVGSILTSIYKLEDVTEFNFADVACCVRCGDILTSLYRFYCEFENFRESSSKLSKAILNNCSHVLVGQVESDPIKCGQFDIVPQNYDDDYDSPQADDIKVELAASSGLTEKDPPLESTSLSLSCQSVWPRVVLTRLKPKVISNATEKFTTKNNSSSSSSNKNNNKQKLIEKHARRSITATASHSEIDKVKLNDEDDDSDEEETNELDEDYEPNDDDEYDGDNNYKIELDSMEAEESDSSEKISSHKKGPTATAIGTKRPHGISIYPCKHCSKSLKTWKSFNYHMRHKHKLNPVDPCSLCGQSFESRSELRKHKQMSHKNENAFKCTNCDQYFKTESRLQEHIEQQHESKSKFSCPNKCRKFFQSKSDVEHHLTEGDGRCPELNKLVTCGICSESIPSYTYTTHMRKIHPGQKFQCTECPNSYSERRYLATHLLTHYGVNQYSCHICGKSFLHKPNLISHIEVHEGIKSHLCTFCGLSFHRLETLKRHTRIHTNEKPYECPTCHKFFRYASGLKRHRDAVHEPSKSYMCAQCGMAFNAKYKLVRHAVVHSDDRPFKCKVPGCDRSFKTSITLRKHVLGALHLEDGGDMRKGRGISKKIVNDDTPYYAQ